MRTTLGLVTLALALSTTPAVAAFPGEPDPSFGTGGSLTTAFPLFSDRHATLHRVRQQADGRIVALGDLAASGWYAIARYLPDGALDTTFAGSGQLVDIQPHGRSPRMGDAVLRPDGSIVVASRLPTFAMLHAYTATGATDGGFASGAGAVLLESSFGDPRLGTYPDGRIVIAFVGPGASLRVARFAADGVLDGGFGVLGVADAFAGTNPTVRAVAIAPDGGILVAGAIGEDHYVARFTADGVLDTAFGSAGRVVTSLDMASVGGCTSEGTHLAIYPDGTFLEAVDRRCEGLILGAVARYGPSGTLDSTFGVGGISGPLPLAGVPSGLVIDPEQRILLSFDDLQTRRLLPQGTVDPTFRIDVGGQLVRQPDGKLLIGNTTQGSSCSGCMRSRFRLYRLESACDGPDTDGDGQPNACDACTSGTDVAKATLVVAKVADPLFDESLTVKASIPFPIPPVLDPAATGIRVNAEEATGGLVASFDLPAGARDGAGQGWTSRVTATRATHRYKSRFNGASAKIVLAGTGATTFALKIKKVPIRIVASHLPAKVTLGLGPACAELPIDGVASSCALTPGALRCKR